MNYVIRKAKVEDIAIINNLLTSLIKDEKQYDININEECLIDCYYENFITDNSHCIFVAEIDNKIVGYLYGFVINSGNVYIDTVTQLDAIFIDKSYRGLGIGENLIEEFKNWSKTKKAKYIEVKVCNENLKALSLYKKQNFKEIKTIMSLNL